MGLRGIVFVASVLLAFAVVAAADQPTSETNQRLKKALARFPEADANDDGVLTLAEVNAYRQQRGGRGSSKPDDAPKPTHTNIKYGSYDRNVFDIWLPESKQPTPLLVFIHGGGFRGGDKEKVHSILAKFNGEDFVDRAVRSGLAVASIQYRFAHFTEEELDDPQKTSINNIVRDAARAVQFMRHHADENNIDPERIACFGGSAGAGTSLWLAFHDDLADPENDDPVLRQSTRISAVGMLNGQFTYDTQVWEDEFRKRWKSDRPARPGAQPIPGAFYGLSPANYDGPEGDKKRRDVDMRGWISPDDPPVFIVTTFKDQPPQTVGQYNHHPFHAQLIQQRCQQQGVDVECLLPGVDPADAKRLSGQPDLMLAFFMKNLGLDPASAP